MIFWQLVVTMLTFGVGFIRKRWWGTSHFLEVRGVNYYVMRAFWRGMIADLKGCFSSNRACTMCDMYCIVHIINQCPFYQMGRVEKYEEIYRGCPNAKLLKKIEKILCTIYWEGKSHLWKKAKSCASGVHRAYTSARCTKRPRQTRWVSANVLIKVTIPPNKSNDWHKLVYSQRTVFKVNPSNRYQIIYVYPACIFRSMHFSYCFVGMFPLSWRILYISDIINIYYTILDQAWKKDIIIHPCHDSVVQQAVCEKPAGIRRGLRVGVW